VVVLIGFLVQNELCLVVKLFIEGLVMMGKTDMLQIRLEAVVPITRFGLVDPLARGLGPLRLNDDGLGRWLTRLRLLIFNLRLW
jgi:hypothetical protein